MLTSRLTLASVLSAAVLLSGCGASVATNTTSTSTTSTTPAPGQFNPNLVPPPVTTTTTTTTTVKKGRKPKVKVKVKTGHSSGTTGSTGGAPVASSGGGGTKTVTVTKTVTITKNHTVIVRPNVPAGAHMPSLEAALGFTHFAAPGGNIGCMLSGGVVRCDIGSRVWSPPAKPKDCNLAWGQGLAVGPSGPARFVCSGDSVLDPTGPQVPAGRDDRVGSLTCQVRSFGVTCFDAAGHGFFISRTGYATF